MGHRHCNFSYLTVFLFGLGACACQPPHVVPNLPDSSAPAAATPDCNSDEDCAAVTQMCHAFACEKGTCIQVFSPGLACDDGDPCTTGDVCDTWGACSATGTRSCDDDPQAPCLQYVCDPLAGKPEDGYCVAKPLTTAEPVPGTCQDLTCQAGAPLYTPNQACADWEVDPHGCVDQYVCDPAFAPEPGLPPCRPVYKDEGSPCRVDGAGVAASDWVAADGAPSVCGHYVCHAPSQDAPSACVLSTSLSADVRAGMAESFPIATSCALEDAEATGISLECSDWACRCKTTECHQATCAFSPKPDALGQTCGDPETCHQALCAPTKQFGEGTLDCVESALPAHTDCSDAMTDACVLEARCEVIEQSFGCQALAFVACEDGAPCFTSVCEGGACVSTPSTGSACDDGIACTLDTCAPGLGCGHEPVAALCADEDPCTADGCDASQGCSHDEILGCRDALCVLSGEAGQVLTCPVQLTRWKAEDPNAAALELSLAWSPELRPNRFLDPVCLAGSCSEIMKEVGIGNALDPNGHQLLMSPSSPKLWQDAAKLAVVPSPFAVAAITTAVYDALAVHEQPEAAFMWLEVEMLATVPAAAPVYVWAQDILGGSETGTELVGAVKDHRMVTCQPIPCSQACLLDPLPAVDGCFGELACDCETIPQACATPDLNADGKVNVVDVQCLLLLATAELGEQPLPGCVKIPATCADLNCSGDLNVTDVVLGIMAALSMPLDVAIDAEQDGTVDACQ